MLPEKARTIQEKGSLSVVFYNACPVECTSHVALQQGFLDESFRSLGTELRHISSMPREEWINHYTHAHPSYIREGGNILPIWARSMGADNVVVGVTFPHRKQALVVRNDGSVESVKKLRGKRIGLPKRDVPFIDFWRATVHRGIVCSLRANGLSDEDVELVDIELSDYFSYNASGEAIGLKKENYVAFMQEELMDLVQGRVDAVYSEGARVGVLEKLDEFRTIYALSSHEELFYRVNICGPCVITVSGELARRYPQIVEKYMEALIRAGIWAKENKEEVISLLSNELGVSREAIAGAFPPNIHELLIPSLGDEGIEALEIEKNFLGDNGYIQNNFEVNDWVDKRFIERAAEKAL